MLRVSLDGARRVLPLALVVVGAAGPSSYVLVLCFRLVRVGLALVGDDDAATDAAEGFMVRPTLNYDLRGDQLVSKWRVRKHR